MEKGARTDAMIEFIDIYPTLAELLKLAYTPEYLEGQCFQRILKNPDQVKDPLEYNNLVNDPEYASVVAEMKELIH